MTAALCGKTAVALFLSSSMLLSLTWLAPPSFFSVSVGLLGSAVRNFVRPVLSKTGSGAQLCTCPVGTAGFQTTVKIENTSVFGSELEKHLVQVFFDTPGVVKSSKSLKVHASDTEVHIEVHACDPSPDPAESYLMATAAQGMFGGAPMSWSAVEDPRCPIKNPDLQQYFNVMSTLSVHKELIASRRSNFSKAAIWRIGNSTRLMLNDLVMSDSRDEHIYHEMLVHPALLAAEQPSRVLIVGGGEGATLREVLRDPRVEHVTMVDVDKGLVELCEKYLPMMHQGSFHSSKVTLAFDHGANFLRRATSESFDVIIVDGIDFGDKDTASYGNELFAQQFYRDAFRVLRRGGTFEQYLSDVDRGDSVSLLLRAGFDDFQYMCVDIDSFFGAGACFALSTKTLAERLITKLEQRVVDFAPQANWTYLTPQVLSHCLVHQARRLKSGGGGGCEGDDCPACFPGEAVAEVRGQGHKQLDEVRVGDEVLVERDGTLVYEPVLGFIHAFREASYTPTKFLAISHEHGEFRASASHIVFVATSTDGHGKIDKTVAELQVGDSLLVVGAAQRESNGFGVVLSKVLQIRQGTGSSGFYAPLTQAGTVVVDGVVASNYAVPSVTLRLSHQTAHLGLLPVRLYHLSGLPKLLRPLWEAVCRTNSSDGGSRPWVCGGGGLEMHGVRDIHPWVALLYQYWNLHLLLDAK